MKLKNKLNRLKPHFSREEQRPAQTTDALVIPYLDEWKKERVSPYYFDNGHCLVREVSYPLSYQHGKYQFQDFVAAVNAWNETNVPHPLSAAGYQPGELFFFDTETTGLGGGTGNTIFLLGHATVTETCVILKQHILPNPGAEIPLYQSFLESINYKTLVTYNGKAL